MNRKVTLAYLPALPLIFFE